MTHTITLPTWWIAHGIYVAYGYVETGEVGTPNQNWETFDSEADWKARLLELGVDPDSQSEALPYV